MWCLLVTPYTSKLNDCSSFFLSGSIFSWVDSNENNIDSLGIQDIASILRDEWEKTTQQLPQPAQEEAIKISHIPCPKAPLSEYPGFGQPVLSPNPFRSFLYPCKIVISPTTLWFYRVGSISSAKHHFHPATQRLNIVLCIPKILYTDRGMKSDNLASSIW